jgi:hypothetical protein
MRRIRPRVLYDNLSGPWLASIVDVSKGPVRFAASASSDPTGTWFVYQVRLPKGTFPDQPILRVSHGVLALGANDFQKGGAFVGGEFWIVNQADTIAGAVAAYANLCTLCEKLTRGSETASLRTRVRRLRRGSRALEGMRRRHGGSEDEAVRKAVTYLRNGMPWWLTFPTNRGMDATNNRGERGLREAIVIRKIIDTRGNSRGARAFPRLLSVLGTWGLRGDDLPTKLTGALSRPS